MTPAFRLSPPLRLAACAGVAAVAWLVVLPRLTRHPPIERHLRTMDERDVNPAAMVYTELERLPLRPDWVDDQLLLWPGTQAAPGPPPHFR